MSATALRSADTGNEPRLPSRRALAAEPIDVGRHADIRVLVVDGQPLSRSGLSRLMRDEGLDVVGEAGDAVTAAAMAQRLRPDVSLMDLALLGMYGVDAVRLMLSTCPSSRIVTIVAAAHQEAVSILAAGALGCILKGGTTRELVGAISAAAMGEFAISPTIVRKLVARLQVQSGDASRHPPALSPREVEVLDLLARGWDNARIATALYLSVGTVKHHISNILSKLGVENRIQAAVIAVRSGLLDGLVNGGRP
jgi:DNA-binding NarL/FixJ family response regulator